MAGLFHVGPRKKTSKGGCRTLQVIPRIERLRRHLRKPYAALVCIASARTWLRDFQHTPLTTLTHVAAILIAI